MVATKQPTNQPSVEHDLGTYHNDLLPDNIQKEIQKQLSDAEYRLASLEATISSSSFDSTINVLKIEHSDLTHRIQSYRIAIAPHRKLPSDILLEIFLRCTTSCITARPHLSGSHAEPHNLVRVCSKWRQLVLHTPELWRDIFVLYETKEDLELNAALVRDIILLCGSASVSLSIQVDVAEGLRFGRTKNPISDLVIELAGRLRDLTWVGKSEILADFLILPAGSVEFLENIHLEFNDRSFDLSLMKSLPIQVFKDAHKLRTFTLEVMPLWRVPSIVISPFDLHLPWNQMAYLKFTDYIMHWEAFLLLLYRCPNLSEFHGSIHSVSRHDDELKRGSLLPTVPVLPNFNQLSISCNKVFEHLFPCLNLPNLTSFQLHDRFGLSDSIDWNATILPFFVRSNRLTDLMLDTHSQVPENIIHGYLHELPFLVSFSLRSGRPLLQETLQDIASGELVPVLETLECMVIEFESFLQILEQRCVLKDDEATRGFTRIRKVVTRSWNPIEVETWNCSERVEKLRAQGLCIEFHFYK
jgi:F-box-like